MKAAERIDLIKRCADGLVTKSWTEIDFVLDQFGFPTTNEWGFSGPEEESKGAYILGMLGMQKGGHDTELLELEEYVGGKSVDEVADTPWQPGRFRLFITHIAAEKAFAGELKASLAEFGIDGFVAHEDIGGGAEWLEIIRVGLQTCDGLVGILHDGFRESPWCDQEVGIVLGRGRPVVPISIDLLPHGFFGALQAIRGTKRSASQIANDVVQILAKDKRSAPALIEGAVSALEAARSYDQANVLATFLATHAVLVTPAQLERLRDAQKTNGQVTDAWYVEGALKKIERELNPS
jgi:hypothetical protein